MKRPILTALVTFALVLPAIALAQEPQVGHVPLAPGVPGPSQLFPLGDETVTLRRDAWGVPHVYADSPYGLGFGNGYAQAQDRLFQIDLLRHVAKGDSAAILGPSQLASDLEVRRELYTDAEREAAYAALPEFERALFDGFAAGANRFIAEIHADPLKMPVEFPALGHEVEPWAATDSVAVAQFLLDTFGSAGGGELANAMMLARLVETLGEEAGRAAFDDVVWIVHESTTPAIPADEGRYLGWDMTTDWSLIPEAQREVALAAADAEPFGAGESLTSILTEKYKFKFGSNAVIVGPEKSKSGGGLLGGGPQMGYYSPMVPYEVGLHGAGFDVAGIGVGGAPGIVIGRTDGFSWTVTSGIGDQVDVVGVKLVPGNARRYYHEGEEKDMECRTEVHVVRASPPTSQAAVINYPAPDVLHQEACRTVYGPVFAINEDSGYAFSRERSHRYEEIPSGVRWLTIGMKKDLEGFRDTLSDFAFTFNFHYVDADHMYFQHVGYQPMRDARLDPRLPRPGGGEYDWKGMLTGDALPHVLDPERGWIVNWNNLPQNGWQGSGDGREQWGAVHRVDVLKERMEAAFAKNSREGKIGIEDVARAVEEAATRDPFARRTVPHLLDAVAEHGDARQREAAQWLTQWKRADYAWAATDGTYEPAHAIYDEWRTLLQVEVFEDELGAFTRRINFDPPTSDDPHGGDHAQHGTKDAILVHALEGETDHAWCDDVATAAAESCDGKLLAALDAALEHLESEYNSTDISTWRMPEHEIVFIAMNAGPAYRMPMMNRASFNHLHDWGVHENRESRSVLPPGAGAGYYPPLHFANYLGTGTLPPHARDQLDAYVAWEYKPFAFYVDEVMDGGMETEMHTLLPTSLASPPPVPG